jgi:3-methyl-2-oxobutanoate hydroxymethyltransferase
MSRLFFHVGSRSISTTGRKLTTLELQHMKTKDKKLSMVTAYDYPSGRHAENAEFDILLVGDSLGMVVLGYETTLSVTMDDMLHHCKAVRRGAPTRFIVGDMPFGSYESGPDEALKNAFRFIKESGVDAVKLEGMSPFSFLISVGLSSVSASGIKSNWMQPIILSVSKLGTLTLIGCVYFD